MSSAAELADVLVHAGVSFRVVGSVAAGAASPRDLDVLVSRSERSASVLAEALEEVAVGEWRGRLRRWQAGAIPSPITIATVLGPLDIWEGEHESDRSQHG